MKLFERIINRQIRDVIQLSTNLCDFLSNSGTIEAIRVAQSLVEKQRPLHIPSLVLYKAFGSVQQKTVWYAPRRHRAPKNLSTDL